MTNSWYQYFIPTLTGSIKIHIPISMKNQQFFVKLLKNKLVMSSEITRYWQRKVTKNVSISFAMSVFLSICHSSRTERISHWSVLLQVYLIFLIFGPFGYHANRNNKWLSADKLVKSGRELGWGFKKQPLKRHALKQHNINL